MAKQGSLCVVKLLCCNKLMQLLTTLVNNLLSSVMAFINHFRRIVDRRVFISLFAGPYSAWKIYVRCVGKVAGE